MAVPEVTHDLSMTECRWQGVDAHGCSFPGLWCRDTVFEGCDLSGAVLAGATLTRVRFVDCRLTGAVLNGAKLNDVVIERGVADLSSYRGSSSTFLWAVQTSLTSADFYDATLRHVALLDSDLTGASFDRCSIKGLSLHGSVVDGLRSVAALVNADVTISSDQAVPLGVAFLADAGVRFSGRPA